MPRPSTVEFRDKLLTYPWEPRPSILEFRDKLLTYPWEPRPVIVELRDKLLTYPSVPKATKLDFRFGPYERLSILAVKLSVSVLTKPPP